MSIKDKTIKQKLKEWCPEEFLSEIDKLNDKSIRKIYDDISELRRGSGNDVKILKIEVEGIGVEYHLTPVKDYYSPEGEKKDYNSLYRFFDML